MRTMIVYESVYGNTAKIAQAVARGLGPQASFIQVQEVNTAELDKTDIVIVGSPTRAFRPMDSIKAFLSGLPTNALQGIKVAAFDTGIAAADIKSGLLRIMVNIGGYAAKPIAGMLRKKGGELIAQPEGFWVLGEKGPLKEGELERAEQWGRQISGN